MINPISLSQINEKIDSLFSDYSVESPGAAVMVIKNGNIILNKGYGLADLENKTYVNSSTNFRLASVTKQFTASAILILVEREKLNLNDKLSDIFEDFPLYGERITIKNLLNHTSGLIDYEDLIPDSATVQVKDKDVLKMMMELDSVYFEPGSKFRYSNTGYALLAMTVEKISGLSFGKFLQENIFDPLDMENTISHEEGITIVNSRAYGYSRKDDIFFKDDQSITSAVLGDGGIYSSTEDIFKWDQSLYTGKILKKETIAKVFERGTLINGELFDYGFGWHRKIYLDKEIVYHTGSTRGFRTVIYRIPSEELTVIILTNRNEGDTEGLAEKIIELL